MGFRLVSSPLSPK